jgi:hypothetical protein
VKLGRWLLAAALCGALAGCTSTPAPQPSPQQTTDWQELSLPVPSGDRAVIRSSATCENRWYLGGSVVDAAGTASPTIWTSTYLRSWTTVPINPQSFYGKQNTIGILGCQAGRIAGIGWQVGGAHGFPRYSGWFPDATGTLQEVDIPYTLFAGPSGVNISGLAVSARGWVLAGNRSSGAASWHSATGQTYTLVEGDPQLATTAQHYTWAGGIAATADGFVIVGAVTPKDTGDRDPAVWTSPDGVTWTPVPVPGSPAFEDPQQVVVFRSTIVTIGISDAGYAVWRGPEKDTAALGWAKVAELGSNGGGNGTATALVAVGGQLYATVADADTYSLWGSPDTGTHWVPVSLPAAAPAKAGMRTFVVSDQDQLLLVIDDGRSSRVWRDASA